MILRMPEYCREFSCLAGKCIDSCCRDGWEIDVDEETMDYYATVGSEFGEKLHSCISAEGCIIPDENGCCPFLNCDGLCDIILTLGEESICRICTEHPRYYEWFGEVKEGGIGMCCEEAARIILSWDKPFALWEREDTDDDCEEFDRQLYEMLLSSRTKIITRLQSRNLPLGKRIADVLEYVEKLQYNADNYNYSDVEITDAESCENGDMHAVMEFLTGLEAINDTWPEYLWSQIKMMKRVRNSIDEFMVKNPSVSLYLENIAVYFVWRYFLKGTFDEEFLSRIKLMAVSTAAIGYLFCCEWLEAGRLTLEQCVEIAKNYSKEVEYSEENLDVLADASYESECFKTKLLSGLFGGNLL